MIRRRSSGPFLRQRDGSFRLNLPPDVRDLVVHLCGELRDVLTQADSTEPALRRLFPTAYHADPERDAEYQDLMRGELTASRLTALSRVIEVFDESDAVISAGDLELFIQTLNAIRLLLGTMLDVNEDDPDEPDPVPDDPDSDDPDSRKATYHHLYAYLGWLLEAAVATLVDAEP